ncbi:MAG: Uma2 family endonuclease, partial [Chloroflexota bacterium]
MVSKRRTYNIEEFEKLIAAEPERRYELVDGDLHEKMPTQVHAKIVALILYRIMRYLEDNPMGDVLPEARYRLDVDDANSFVPDLSFVTIAKGPLAGDGAAPYTPELAVEVQSPGQSDRFLADKATYYLANGSRMVWLVYPNRRLVEVLTLDDRHLLTVDMTNDGA